MKRLYAALLAFFLLLSPALAREGRADSLWDSLGDWLDRTWRDASDLARDACGDASRWIGQVWDDSSEWVSEIWGDVSDRAAEAYRNAGAWWAETFEAVTDRAGGAWDWIRTEAAARKPEFVRGMEAVREAVSARGKDAEAAVRNRFDALLEKLDLGPEDAQRVWDSVRAYAERKGIPPLAAETLALPYLFRLTEDAEGAEENMPAVAVAQYLTAAIEKLGVRTAEGAEALLDQLRDALESVR